MQDRRPPQHGRPPRAAPAAGCLPCRGGYLPRWFRFCNDPPSLFGSGVNNCAPKKKGRYTLLLLVRGRTWWALEYAHIQQERTPIARSVGLPREPLLPRHCEGGLAAARRMSEAVTLRVLAQCPLRWRLSRFSSRRLPVEELFHVLGQGLRSCTEPGPSSSSRDTRQAKSHADRAQFVACRGSREEPEDPSSALPCSPGLRF